MNEMDHNEIKSAINRFHKNFSEFGYSPKTLGWLKGKQDIRFNILTSEYDFNNKTVLDIGCGFGDLNKTLSEKFSNYQYIGCDLCPDLLNEGKKHFPNAVFYEGDFLSLTIPHSIDWAVASGPFNHFFEKNNNYEFIKSCMQKAFHIAADGFSFDFIGDRVDYKENHIFYSNPETILSFAYELSQNVILKSNYMPFEFSIFVFKDDSFDSDTIFRKYKHDKNI